MTSLFLSNFGDDVDPFGNSSRSFCPRGFNCSAEPSFVSFDIGRIPSYIAIASGSLSCLGAILIVLVFWLFRDLRTGAQKIITLLAIADFITAVGYITGSINFLVYFDEDDSKKCRQFEIICEVQASVTSLSSLCSFYWTLILAFHFYLIFVYNYRPLALRLFPLYNIIAWGTPFLVIVPLIVLRKLGYAPYATANWCFVKEIRYDSGLLDHYKSIIFIFLAGKFWEILTYFGVIIMYVHIAGHISRLEQHYPRYQDQDAELQQQVQVVAGKNRFMSIPVFFLLLRLWGTVQFFYSIAMSGKLKNHDGCLPKGVHTGFYILGIMQAIGDPGQGWSNAILFVFMSPVVRKRLFCIPALRPRAPAPRPPGPPEQPWLPGPRPPGPPEQPWLPGPRPPGPPEQPWLPGPRPPGSRSLESCSISPDSSSMSTSSCGRATGQSTQSSSSPLGSESAVSVKNLPHVDRRSRASSYGSGACPGTPTSAISAVSSRISRATETPEISV